MAFNKIVILILCTSCLQVDLSAQAIQGKLLGTWTDTTLIPSRLYGNSYNEIWGLTIAGREYAIQGTSRGTHFIDVTDPSQPIHSHLIEGGSTGAEIVHRDYHDQNGFLYAVSDEGPQSSLQIIDLSYLPDSVPVIYDSKSLINRSHNIFIDTSSSILYACSTIGSTLSKVPLRLFDISDPYTPKVISEFREINGIAFSQVHDAYVIQDTAYLNIGNDGLIIAEFSDPLEPKLVGNLGPQDYPQAGYNHSGWLSEDRQTYVMSDETWGTDLKVLDVSELPEIRLIDTLNAGSPIIFSISHNQIIAGNYLYGAYYYDGLQVWDISDPTNSERVMHYPTSSQRHRQSYEGAWGVYPFLPSGNILVSDMQEGLFVLESIEKTLSTEEPQLNLDKDWQLLPNPSSGNFQIESKLNLADYKLSLLDSEGKLVQSLDSSGHYELNNMTGIHFVRIQNKHTSSIKTLILVRD